MLVPASAAAEERTVSVKGTATQEVPNDTASLRFSVSKERRSRTAALRVVSIRLREVIAAVQGIGGVGPGDVATGAISVREVSRNERTLYRASESVTVILHQPERAGEMVNVAVAAGATGTGGPRFFPDDPEAAYNSTLIAAFDQAKAKASALASRAGATLGPAVTIEEGSEVVPGQPQSRSEQPAETAPPTKPGASTVTATVRVVFALE
ncbi:MAG TPA: SIMPL domain-containing protein [Solirubrobacterales bacterium]|nr:SIMPL domain-containing protein [Solirubrobacterales bacterium]